MFKDAFWLVKMEYKQQWIAVISTFIMCLIVGLFMGTFLSGFTSFHFEVNSTSFDSYFLDFLFLGLAPSFATLSMAKPYLSYRVAKHNPYGKRMAVLRSLPISVSVLALSRTLFMLCTLVIMSFAFFGAMSIIILIFSNNILEWMTIGDYVIFVFVWFGFMLTIGGLNPYVEYGMKGKMLHFIPFIYMGFVIIIEIIFFTFFNQSVIEAILQLIKSYGFIVAIVSILIGIVSCYEWNKILKRRLEKRDYI
ncbi:hypothetical protein DTX80_16135 [Bacilli bacterium]|uniref:ABC transporter permease n=1 Tax=Oceanobacillus caeni TaxID=405946 RepID=A0ABR5MIS8_9BACI|nr:hypothetical protein [Virgibacillus sp. SK37]KKE80770.1 hypothetical protein WH51_00020 [Bacilli bacterium VT-13-104]KPH74604.1 hypothetical protein AFL42_09660 [Oceanobacillus caeni]PZD83019.1 hypothetical protein DEJ64_16590 [Bacilli bacterium]PZD83836.1 hypothetical protein DEJ60_16320 [Bacilli bacterium]PZD85626.1 hypothetical protein DEJ66_16720 [Bacilli bacterium]